MSGGHGSSRRRSYGRRQKDLRDRHASELSVDLEGPAAWPRGAAWDRGVPAPSPSQGMGRQQPGGAA